MNHYAVENFRFKYTEKKVTKQKNTHFSKNIHIDNESIYTKHRIEVIIKRPKKKTRFTKKPHKLKKHTHPKTAYSKTKKKRIFRPSKNRKQSRNAKAFPRAVAFRAWRHRRAARFPAHLRVRARFPRENSKLRAHTHILAAISARFLRARYSRPPTLTRGILAGKTARLVRNGDSSLILYARQ